MADLKLLIADKNAETGVLGTPANAKTMGKFLPSFVTPDRQFLRPIDNAPYGMKVMAGTYAALSTKDENGALCSQLFGTDVDLIYNDIRSMLDTGAVFQNAKDYYVYLVRVPAAGSELQDTAKIVVSLNSTFPEGSDADNSRKIGGFHTLCADVGQISGHPLSGFVAGNILPASFWDLSHRPTCQPEGMVYIDLLDFWCDIYLQSGSGVNTKSVYLGTTTDTQAQSQHVEDLFMVGKTLLNDAEFQCAAEGSNQKTNIRNSADAVTTGGHVDTAGRRMISNYGCEDMCGFLWQWMNDLCYMQHSTAPEADPSNKGGIWHCNALRAGGGWSSAAGCGSRARGANDSRLAASAVNGGRGRARSRG